MYSKSGNARNRSGETSWSVQKGTPEPIIGTARAQLRKAEKLTKAPYFQENRGQLLAVGHRALAPDCNEPANQAVPRVSARAE